MRYSEHEAGTGVSRCPFGADRSACQTLWTGGRTIKSSELRMVFTLVSPHVGKSTEEVRLSAKYNAEGVLEAHWDGSFPVDPAVIAARVGVEVFNAQLGNDVYGILQRKPGGSPQIYLDVDQPVNRWRFSCAHELGHYIDRSSRLDEDIEYIERRSDTAPFSNDEIFANEFAGNLLMPEADVRARLEAGMSTYQIAQEFGVSLDALLYRKRLLGIV